jgi:2,3-bisphosphoglycerate-dependent phosphoglycerate mutase
MAKLVLVRHGESEWNAKGLWTGWTDVNLSQKGQEEARNAGKKIKDIHFDFAYTSALKRAQQTLYEILTKIHQTDLQPIINKALNERNYGDMTAKNKWEVKEQLGDEEFQKIRRSWDYPPPNGESLKMVYERVFPYYKQEILPKLKTGKNVIIAAHGNSLRALIKYLEHISDTDIPKLEMATGSVYVYDLDTDGKILTKTIRATGDIQ